MPLLSRKSRLTGKTHTLDIAFTKEQWASYVGGTLIQDAFPNLTASEREFILSGITDEEWRNHFGKDESEGPGGDSEGTD